MKRQEPRQVIRTIQLRARWNAYTYTQHAFESMVDRTIYEEDVKRALTTARLLDVRESPLLGTCYIVAGFGMNEDELILVCRLLRRKVEVLDFHWAAEEGGENS